MTSLHVRQLSESEIDHITSNSQLAEERGLLQSLDMLDTAAGELRRSTPTDLSADVDILGAALGLHLSQRTQMQWAALTDGVESAIVLIGTAGQSTIVVYPFDVAQRRWKDNDDETFQSYVAEVLQAIEQSETDATAD
ncbi:DUF3806 domain-containing protein [Arcanobacterium pinnipediorum]|uniref:DUF3806 domain-containing protein n=1 Tax=Arcanobacterium pinnipediorum TaxID=1503041 RepID=A0ABY5AH67_9ACTO|nr:DUF3806 domain-containing protein [Arcanobacterium pinnipediorum]USR79554.1 DUF3806 domain-containing protein [Arcanobacterium pinnipediorum]